MKRVYLRVLDSGNILICDGGDVVGNTEIIGEWNKTGAPEVDYSERPVKNFKVLPFYSMTDREEAELLLGRSMTEGVLAQLEVTKQNDKISALRAEEAALEARGLQVAVSPSNSGVTSVGFALKERIEAQKELIKITERAEEAFVKSEQAAAKAFKAAKAEAAKSSFASRGVIPKSFGMNCK